jgi:hypothetical protein
MENHQNYEPISPSKCRNEFFPIIDEIIKTGSPKFINRNGVKLKICIDEPPSLFEKLGSYKKIVLCSDEELLESTFDMGEEWDEPNKLK